MAILVTCRLSNRIPFTQVIAMGRSGATLALRTNDIMAGSRNRLAHFSSGENRDDQQDDQTYE